MIFTHLEIYDCQEGLNTLLKGVDESQKLFPSSLLDDNNPKQKQSQKEGTIGKKDNEICDKKEPRQNNSCHIRGYFNIERKGGRMERESKNTQGKNG